MSLMLSATNFIFILWISGCKGIKYL